MKKIQLEFFSYLSLKICKAEGSTRRRKNTKLLITYTKIENY